MSFETHYYECEYCHRHPHVKVTEEIRNKISEEGISINVECEFCLNVFTVTAQTPTCEPDLHLIRKVD